MRLDDRPLARPTPAAVEELLIWHDVEQGIPGGDGSVGASGMHITCRGSSGSHGDRTAACRCDPGRIRRLAREDCTLRTTPSMKQDTT